MKDFFNLHFEYYEISIIIKTMYKTLATNKRASFDYELLDRYEAGLVLTGQEVKSAKQGHISLTGSFVTTHENQIYLTNCHISPYKFAGKLPDYDPTRSRKLLLKKREINSLIGISQQKGLTLVPIKVYIKNSLVKLEFAAAKGKKKIDKREHIKEREDKRRIERTIKNNF